MVGRMVMGDTRVTARRRCGRAVSARREPRARAGGRLGRLCLLAWALCAPALAQAPIERVEGNLVRNGRFERDLDGDGRPDGWNLVTASQQAGMLLEAGQAGQRCVVLWNQAVDQEVAIAQVITRPIAAPEWYRMTVLVRAVDVGSLSVEIDGPDGAERLGPPTRVRLSADWSRRTAYLRMEKPAESGVIKLAFRGVGEVRLDDVVLQQLSPSQSSIWPLEDVPNLVYNGSFEAGSAGWATMGYGGLVGALDNTTAIHGRRSFRVVWSKEVLPWVLFDFPKARLGPVDDLQVATLGWMRFSPGTEYSFSLYLRSDRENVPVQFSIVFLDETAATAGQEAVVGTQWQRYRGTFTPSSDLGFLVIHPTSIAADDQATSLWIDGVSVSSGPARTGYQSRCPIEVGLDTDRPGHVCAAGEKVVVRIEAYNYGSEPFNGNVRVRTTDYFDALVSEEDLPIEIAPDAPARLSYELPTTQLGFFRVTATLPGVTPAPVQQIRVARLPGFGQEVGRQDSVLGLNHGYPFERQLTTLRDAGLRWVRTWALNWGEVEPEQGQWRFDGADAIIRELERSDLNILACLPFPSAPWSNQVDDQTMRKLAVPSSLGRVCFMPDDPALFGLYVSNVAARYEGRIAHYELLNEPLVSAYCLPMSLNTPADYAALARVGAESIRDTDAGARVIGGLGILPEPGRPAMSAYRETLAGGLGAVVDALNIHAYPRTDSPEHVATLLSDFGALARIGVDRPLPVWATEFGYFADDDPGPRAIPQTLFGTLASERECATYTVQVIAAMLATGVDRVFLSTWPEPPNVATATTDPFFEWDGQARKPLAAVAAFTSIMGPAPESQGVEIVGGAVTAFLFENASGAVAAIWPLRTNQTGQRLVLDVAEPGMGPSVQVYDEIGNVLATFDGGQAFRYPLPVDRGQVYVSMAGGNAEDLRQLLSRALMRSGE